MSAFVHLHVHTEYSLTDGSIRIPDLLAKVKALGHEAVAITDHSNMFGAIDFYSQCKDAGIKAIIGAEILHEGQAESRAHFGAQKLAPGLGGPFHLVLLARSQAGYKRLMQIVSAGHLRQDGPVPITLETELAPVPGELIALSSCLKGEFASLVAALAARAQDPLADLREPRPETTVIVAALQAHVAAMQARFGPDGYYIELIDNHLAAQAAILPLLAAVAEHFKLPLVATADAHYLNPEDQEAHTVLVGIKNDLTMATLRSRRRDTVFHLLNNEEMASTYARWPEALANTLKIAAACQLKIETGNYYLPQFEVTGGDVNAALANLARTGLGERLETLRPLYGKSFTSVDEEKYYARLDYEIGVIVKMGFPGYFLIVQDFINWAKQHGIPVGPGRGSGAGSIVAYALKITDLDPIPLNLIFERFLNPERVSMPDFDIDFCQDRRDEVIAYVSQKYGANQVAQITTFGKMKAKAAIRDVGRVLGIQLSKVDRVAKLVPNELEIKLKDAIAREPRLMEEANKDENIRELLQLAQELEGLCRHTSVHAAGVVISDGPMEQYVPVYRSPEGALITQYEMKNAEKVGLVKFDFLGLKTLTVIERAVRLIREQKEPEFNIATLPLEDSEVYDLVSSGHTTGIFQLESGGMQALLTKLQPSRFEDLVAVVALFRPGPLGSGMIDSFIERKHGREAIVYMLPELEPILKDTYGIIVYQEQVQKIAASLANYSLGEADLLRRAMGKKKPEEMAKQKSRFVSGCTERNLDAKVAAEVFDLMAKFAEYGFNKSHSAAYGLISYQTAYLKMHYPEEFMAALMTCDFDDQDKLVRYIDECRRLRIKVLPLDINHSQIEFAAPAPKVISFALSAIKGAGVAGLKQLIDERQRGGSFRSFTDLAHRLPLASVSKKTLELLVHVGAFDSFGLARQAVVARLGDLVKQSEARFAAQRSGARLLFAEAEDSPEADTAWEQGLQSLSVRGDPLEPLLKEKKLLGVFLSQHPVSIFPQELKRFGRVRISELATRVGSKGLACVCFLQAIDERTSKTGKQLTYITLEDDTGSVEALMFRSDRTESLPEPGRMVLAQFAVKYGFQGAPPRIAVETLTSLEEFRRQQVRHLLVELRSDLELKPEELVSQTQRLRQMATLAAKYPGATDLWVRLHYGRAVVNLTPAMPRSVDLSDNFMAALRPLLGDGLRYEFS